VAFFKSSAPRRASRLVARLDALIWILIYAGLLVLVLGLSMSRVDEEWAWSLVAAGGVVAALGFALIYARSKIKSPP
jgi:vacuolar-type H+-ATPase subunit I/STV1